MKNAKYAQRGNRQKRQEKTEKVTLKVGDTNTPGSNNNKAGKSKTKQKTGNNIRLIINRGFAMLINSGGWIWLVGLICVGILVVFGSNLGGSYSPLPLFELEFDRNITTTDVEQFITDNPEDFTGVNPEQIKVIGGNKAEFRSRAAGETLVGFSERFADNDGIIVASAYQVVPDRPLASDLPRLGVAIGALLVVATITSFAIFRDKDSLYKVKLATMAASVPIISGLVLAAVGVILSQLGLIYFDPVTYQLFMGMIGLSVVLSLFIVSEESTRKTLSKAIFGSKI